MVVRRSLLGASQVEGQTAGRSTRPGTSRLQGSITWSRVPHRPVGTGPPRCDSASVRVDAARPTSGVRGSRELAVWLAPAVAVALAQIAAQLVDYQLYDLHVRALNADSDASVVAWLTPAGIALALAGVLARLRRHDRARARGAVIATLLVGLLVVACARRGAFGESLSLHRSTLMLAPAVALLLALLLREAREVGATARGLLEIGCALLVSSYVLHLVGGALADAVGGEHSWTYQVGAALKEGTEVAGWLIVGLGCCRAAARDG